MTMRSTTRSTADRGGQMIGRATVQASDDSKKMQELTTNNHFDEKMDGIEHFHPYGFTAVPLDPDKSGQAEAIVAFVHGCRSHGAAIVTSDRRYRLMNNEKGEVAIHDDQGQKVHLTRNGIVIESSKPMMVRAPSATWEIDNLTHKGNLSVEGSVTAKSVTAASGSVPGPKSDS